MSNIIMERVCASLRGYARVGGRLCHQCATPRGGGTKVGLCM